MENIIFRQNKMFCIDKDKLSSKAKNTETINALYAAIYTEFSGASKNEQYKNLTPLERLQKVNEFANKWLSQRGLK